MHTQINTKPDETSIGWGMVMRDWNLEKRAELPYTFGHPELNLIECPDGVKSWNITQHVARNQHISVKITNVETGEINATCSDRRLTLNEERAIERLKEFVRAVILEYGPNGVLAQSLSTRALHEEE